MEIYRFTGDFLTASELGQQWKYFPGMWLTHAQVIPVQSKDLKSLVPII